MPSTFTEVNFRKLGNHWYLDIDHNDPRDLVLYDKVERVLDLIDAYKFGHVSIYIVQQGIIIHTLGLVEFKDSEITRYISSDCPFNMTVKIDGHDFIISSKILKLIEANYDVDIARDIYRLML